MQVHIEEVSPVEKKLAVEVEWPLVEAKLDAAYRELGRDVSIRGFRKGKVPRSILERMFARRVEGEVIRQLIQESLLRAAHDHSIEPVAEPIVDDVQLAKGTPFRYSARLEVRAPVDPREYEGVPLERPAPTVSVEEIDQALERKREELSEYKQIEGRDALGASDVVICDVRGELGGRAWSRESVPVDLAHPERDPIPGLGAALAGRPFASKEPFAVELDLGAPAGGDEQAAQRKARLQISIRDAREKSTPALDDDFAKDTGEADTLDELRAKVREQLLADKEKDVTRELRSALVQELLRRNDFQVAPSLVDRQSEILLHRAKLTMAMQGMDVSGAVDDAQMKDRLRSAAADEVRTMLLLDAIATKEKVEVTEADMEKRLAEMARARDTSVPRLKAELQKEKRFEVVRMQLREEKTLDLLLSRANITRRSEVSSPSETA